MTCGAISWAQREEREDVLEDHAVQHVPPLEHLEDCFRVLLRREALPHHIPSASLSLCGGARLTEFHPAGRTLLSTFHCTPPFARGETQSPKERTWSKV